MVSNLYRLSINLIRESRRKKNCVRKRIINGSQVAKNALYKSAGRGKKKDETIFILFRCTLMVRGNTVNVVRVRSNRTSGASLLVRVK